ncbi:MAG: Npt1/Npt2 family nucleotide transporter [Vicinamibacterales bacterium]|jgi:ATP/ADP translocase/HEAT repeat protein|nr:hypothetical protein [Acidobacteriota bacterium]MDP7294873.1 Npt1/Npt2 family nucleotide transporter [Vicinamibacterales bacterium]MDP7471591.1 Npt1/Npt2 family nucleotide transporter [Vicinamibacterales bacterium]MDP7670639.1 Npt1/Npt2 family nucleotide transporter [Vicinamibacterales bacterium]HJO39078.1 Npt1/Npt2 family nucleotide transporter [Vicinamibacterales bacterium]
MAILRRLLSPIAQLRDGEASTALLMFAYSFLVMTAYNAVKPITRSAFIRDLGADNLPYVLLASGLIIGIIMTGYAWLMKRLPRRWGLPIIQLIMIVVLALFWVGFQTEQAWVSIAFYVWGQILGVLLISQFWTMANVLYDARQAKRLFGFIGGGAPLGGMAGSAVAVQAATIGTTNLLLLSAVVLALAAGVVVLIVTREQLEVPADTGPEKPKEAIGTQESVALLRRSSHLQIIAIIISLAAVGAAIVDQQLNMAAEATSGRDDVDAITAFLGLVGLYMSGIGLFVQVWLTSRIHRFLGIGFALMILPAGLGATAMVMLFNAALWAPAMARILDQSLRYTVDKTTREILFLPLPADVKLRAKTFVDVTVDRGAKAVAALLLLVLVQPWGLALDWQQLSYASLGMMVVWLVMSVRARRGYLAAFRRSLERREVEPTQLRLGVADLSTVETLVEELAHPDGQRVLYAIEVLESLDKRNLVTPLLLHHDSAAVRARALKTLGDVRSDIAQKWVPSIERLLADTSPEVRVAAVRAIAKIRNADSAALVRPLLDDADPRMVATAGIVLAAGDEPDDVKAGEDALSRLAADTRATSADVRREVAIAIRHVGHRRCEQLLIPLLYDPDPGVAAEAMRSVRALGTSDVLFVPTLISLLGHRDLKSNARAVLVEQGDAVLDALASCLADPDENLWVRRHLPATIARIPGQAAMNILVDRLEAHEPDGLLRFKLAAALGKLRRDHPEYDIRREPVEAMLLNEARGYFENLTLYHNLFVRAQIDNTTLLAHALADKRRRSVDRIYRMLGLIYPSKDVSSARWAIEHGHSRARASAFEYLENLLSANLRKFLMPILDELPLDEEVRRGNVLLKTRPRDEEETLLHLINHDDEIVSACAISLVEKRKQWSLAPDLEHVLAHRRPDDWFVFEAASWALAAQSLPGDRRRSLWQKPLPAVELVARLRETSVLAAVPVEELFGVVSASRQVKHGAGQVIFQAGVVPDSLQVLLDGTVAVLAGGVATAADSDDGDPLAPSFLTAPRALALEEVLQGRPVHRTYRAEGSAVTLSLDSDQLCSLLADNIHLVEGLFQVLVGRSANGERLVLPGAAGDEVSLLARLMTEESASAGARLMSKGAHGDEIARLAAGGLTPVQRVLVLGRIPMFARVSAEEMLYLASIVHEVPLAKGQTLAEEADPPALCVVLSGELSLDAPSGTKSGEPVVAKPGDAIGVFETLAGVSIGRHAVALSDGMALHIGHDDLFDLLAHRPALLRQFFGALFGA